MLTITFYTVYRVKVTFSRTKNAHFLTIVVHADPISDIKGPKPERSFISDKNIDNVLSIVFIRMLGRPVLRKLRTCGSVLLKGPCPFKRTAVG